MTDDPSAAESGSWKAVLTEGPVGRTLTRLTVPMVAGIVGMVAFNLTDTFFVSRLGTTELAALSFTFPLVLVLVRFTLGLGIGASSLISRAVGRGDAHAVQRITTDSLSLALLLVIIFVAVGFPVMDPVFRALGAEGEILSLVKTYMSIWLAGLLFVFFPSALSVFFPDSNPINSSLCDVVPQRLRALFFRLPPSDRRLTRFPTHPCLGGLFYPETWL